MVGMGLDTFAYKKDIDGDLVQAPDELFEGILLCGGLFSGGGSSFRGKVYARQIEEITGVSLYNELIDEETVKKMAVAISKYAASVRDCHHLDAGEKNRCETCELPHLKRWFQVAADNDCVVSGWW